MSKRDKDGQAVGGEGEGRGCRCVHKRELGEMEARERGGMEVCECVCMCICKLSVFSVGNSRAAEWKLP